MEPVTTTIVPKVVAETIGILIPPVKRQFGYLIHFKENIKNLEDEFRRLRDLIERNQASVNMAEMNGDIVEADVKRWLENVQKMKEEVEEFSDKVKENKSCLKGLCPDLGSRYRLSKEAKGKKDDVVKLKGDGSFQKMSHPAPPPEFGIIQSSGDYKAFDSRVMVFNDIMEALKDSNVNMIGIYGMGGVGKTTMAVEVGKQTKKDGLFHEIAMSVVSQKVDVKTIQGKLASCLNFQLKKEDEDGRAGELWKRLNNGKKNLVILDDVWTGELQLNKIGIPLTDGCKGCKVVITSRKQDVCQKMQVQRYFSIQVLSKQEAWTLFKENVGNSVEYYREGEIVGPSWVNQSSQDVCKEEIARDVCEECGCLPIAILAVAAALKGKDKEVWYDALNQLRNSMLENIEEMDPQMYKTLMLSYNHLQTADAKSCFLLCCLFAEDVDISIDDLVRYGVGMELLGATSTLEETRQRVYSILDTLKNSCLLLKGPDKNIVKMHDVIRDVGISIASEERQFLVKTGVQKWPYTSELPKAISLWSMDIHELPDDLECPELHTLVLDGRSQYSITVPDSFFNGMEKLKVLSLSRMLLLPSSLQILVNLRMLSLTSCELVDFSILKQLKKLEILVLNDSNIQALPPEISQLTRLQLLDLRGCKKLIVIPPHVISSLTRLEELCISDDFDQWEVESTDKERSNTSLVELDLLTHLTALELHIPDVTFLPKKLLFEKLIRFRISMGDRFDYQERHRLAWTLKRAGIPLKDVSLARTLKLVGIPLKDEFNILMGRAEVLYLNKLKGLNKVLHDRVGEWFLDLKFLDVQNCNDIEHLLGRPKGFSTASHRQLLLGSFCKLTVLEVSSCRLKYLFSPSTASGLVQLQQLVIRRCDVMEEIIGNESEGDEEEVKGMIVFPQLKEMILSGLPRLKSFYPKMKKTSTAKENSSTTAQPFFNEKVAFPALEELMITHLDHIKEIWGNQLLVPVPEEKVSFSQLKVLRVRKCEELVNTLCFRLLPTLQNLETLSVSDCSSLISLVVEEINAAANDEAFVFPRLKTLYLEKLGHLESFCSSRSKEEEEEEEEEEEKVKKADTEEDKSQAQSLFNHKVSFPALKNLCIGMLEIREIWNKQLLAVPKELEESFSDQLRLQNVLNKDNSQGIVVCPNLTTLSIYGCAGLRNVFSPSTARNLVHLQEIDINDCEMMEEILATAATRKGRQEKEANDKIIIFRQLRELCLKRLPKLKGFCCSSESEEQEEETMKEMDPEQEIPHAQPFFNHEVAFPALEELMIRQLDHMKEIWGNQLLVPAPEEKVSFSQLKVLEVSECKELVNMVPSNMLPRLPNLETLSVSDCSSLISLVVEEINAAANDEVFIFPRLKTLRLEKLGHLKSFCSSRSKEEEEEEEEEEKVKKADTEEDKSQAQSLFNHKVAFPELEKLYLIDAVNSVVIFPGHDLPANFLCKLKVLKLQYCHKLSTVVSPNLLQRLQNLEKLRVKDCNQVTKIFDLEGLNVGEGQVELLSRLRMLKLIRLPKLNCLWNKDPHGILSFQSLRLLRVWNCGLLRNLLSSSEAMALEQLRQLDIWSCKGMEEVVANEVGEEVANEMVFHKLKILHLRNLPNLTSFCSANSAIRMPSLKAVGLQICPKVQTFTPVEVSMPSEIKFTEDGKKFIYIRDLNYFIQQRVLKRKGLARDDNNDEEVTALNLDDTRSVCSDSTYEFYCNDDMQ